MLLFRPTMGMMSRWIMRRWSIRNSTKLNITVFSTRGILMLIFRPAMGILMLILQMTMGLMSRWLRRWSIRNCGNFNITVVTTTRGVIMLLFRSMMGLMSRWIMRRRSTTRLNRRAMVSISINIIIMTMKWMHRRRG